MRDKKGKFLKGHKINAGGHCSIETKRKLRLRQLGRKRSEETKRKH